MKIVIIEGEETIQLESKEDFKIMKLISRTIEEEVSGTFDSEEVIREVITAVDSVIEFNGYGLLVEYNEERN